MAIEDKLIECVPNFSEGNDLSVIKKITDSIESVVGIKLLHVDAGKAANRTVVTFAGHPAAVIEAAFRAIKTAGECIDMSKQKGEHPRLGATDVCPLIPIANISMEETIEYSKILGRKVGEELGIPVYLYEASATRLERKNLATVRSGEYEGLVTKIVSEEWKPDYGKVEFNVKSGATIIGARDFLIAYNINIDSQAVEIATEIACALRESGRVKRIGDPAKGPIVKDAEGNIIRTAGALKAVKAIGWFIKEYGIAQVSINIINYRITPFHIVFEEASKIAATYNVKVTGSELIGLIPLQAMLDAGAYYINKFNLSKDLPQDQIIEVAIKYMGLNELAPFDPKKKIIDFLL